MKPREGTIDQIIDQNIQSLIDMRKKLNHARSPQDKIVEAVAQFTGSVWFIYLHLLMLGLWVFCNTSEWSPWKFDPFPFIF
jgi:uncharacterized membrane protein